MIASPLGLQRVRWKLSARSPQPSTRPSTSAPRARASLQVLQHQRRRALGHHEAVPRLVEGPRRTGRFLVARGKRRKQGEADQRLRLHACPRRRCRARSAPRRAGSPRRRAGSRRRRWRRRWKATPARPACRSAPPAARRRRRRGRTRRLVANRLCQQRRSCPGSGRRLPARPGAPGPSASTKPSPPAACRGRAGRGIALPQSFRQPPAPPRRRGPRNAPPAPRRARARPRHPPAGPRSRRWWS